MNFSLAQLSEGDRNAYLLRVAQGDTHVVAELMQHLRKEFGTGSKPSASSTSAVTMGRTLAEILVLAKGEKEDRKKREKAAAEQARQVYLQGLVPKVDRLWTDVSRLIGYGKAKSYDEAVTILQDLRDVAQVQGDVERFGDRIVQLMSKYSSRRALLLRIRNANLHN